ncbi:MAG: hypothetical protein ACP5OY_08335 [Halothiobacillaceae bacterium]
MAMEDAWLESLAAAFVRGATATGIVAAIGDKREGQALLAYALLGGAALAAATGVEGLLFEQEAKMAGKKGKKKGKGKVDLATLQEMLQKAQQPRGLAALPPAQQFLLGAILGGAAAYVLGDEALRGRLMRMGLKLYAQMASGLEEMKEQLADIQAELEAEQRAL